MFKKNAIKAKKVLGRGMIGVFRLYQLCISPYMKPRCRYLPTCSHYMIDALKTHGLFKGLWLGTCRLLRCHPFHAGGFDPVPQQDKEK